MPFRFHCTHAHFRTEPMFPVPGGDERLAWVLQQRQRMGRLHPRGGRVGQSRRVCGSAGSTYKTRSGKAHPPSHKITLTSTCLIHVLIAYLIHVLIAYLIHVLISIMHRHLGANAHEALASTVMAIFASLLADRIGNCTCDGHLVRPSLHPVDPFPDGHVSARLRASRAGPEKSRLAKIRRCRLQSQSHLHITYGCHYRAMNPSVTARVA